MAKRDGGKQIRDFLKAEMATLAKGINKETAEAIGDAVIEEMKSMVAKGISPIEGEGRFPEYKAVTEIRGLKEFKKKSPKSSRSREDAGRLIRARTSRGYPYSVQDKFPGKKPRPVNLTLSGKFLSKLKKFISGQAGQKIKIEVGFADDKVRSGTSNKYVSVIDMEKGHREGANGQLKRPIIPERNENFERRIQVAIEKSFATALAKYYRSRRR